MVEDGDGFRVFFGCINRAVALDIAIRDVEQRILSNGHVDVGEFISALSLNEEEEECAICLESQRPLHQLTTCSHSFCQPCLQSWLSIRRACPLCRQLIQANAQEVIPVDDVKEGLRMLRQLVYALMCEEARSALASD